MLLLVFLLMYVLVYGERLGNGDAGKIRYRVRVCGRRVVTRECRFDTRMASVLTEDDTERHHCGAL